MTKIKKSLTLRVFIIIFISLLVILLFSRLLFQYYAPKYYYQKQMEKMTVVANSLSGYLEAASTPQEINKQVTNNAARMGGIINITDHSGKIIYSSQYKMGSGEATHIRGHMGGVGQNRRIHKDMYYSTDLSDSYKLVNYDLETKNYIITTSMTVPAIEESISTLANLYNYLLLGSLFIALIISYFVARHITSPLVVLNETAKELAELDFSRRYVSNREDEIGQLSSTLNHMAKKLQTTIERLRQELSRQQQSEQLRRNFVARVSHELQTPLAVILGYTEALSDNIVDSQEELGEYYLIIQNEAETLSRMVQELLELSKLENPKYTFNKVDFDLTILVNSIVKKFKNALLHKEKNLTFKLNGFSNNYVIYGDENRLEQAISNIIKNAIAHTPKNGFIEITSIGNNNETTIEIFNSGSTIAEENLANIWDSFYTTNIEKESGAGSGLGLAIAKQIFLRHEALYGARNVTNGVVVWFSMKNKGEI